MKIHSIEYKDDLTKFYIQVDSAYRLFPLVVYVEDKEIYTAQCLFTGYEKEHSQLKQFAVMSVANLFK